VQAAQETLNFKGNPTSQEGKECRQSMVTKESTQQDLVDELIGEIIKGAKLFLSGGQEQPLIVLRVGVEDAAKLVLNRLYPKFDEGDSAKWPQVSKKAKEGSPNALAEVGFAGDPQTHPVAVAIIAFIGSGKTGLEVRKKFNAPPFGWPQDGIDAVLTTLLASNHLSARINGTPLSLAEVDIKKLGHATFRIESPVLTATQKIAIRKLFQEAGFTKFTPGNEPVDAIRFIEYAKSVAAQAGGDAPAPAAPAALEIIALESHSGNDLLMELHDQRVTLLKKIQNWQSTGKEIVKRLPAFNLTEKLLAHAAGLPEQAKWSATLSSVRANRSLLDDPDPVSQVRKEVANELRAKLAQEYKANAGTVAEQTARVASQVAWQKLSEEKRHGLLSVAGALERTAPTVASDEQLLSSLQLCSLANWQAQTDALPAQFDKALAAAIIEAEPKAKRVFTCQKGLERLDNSTLCERQEIDMCYLPSHREKIRAGSRESPSTEVRSPRKYAGSRRDPLIQ
jgi:hypothetical protein